MLENLKYRIGFAIVDVLDWIAEKMHWVHISDYDRILDANFDLLERIHKAENEIIRLRKKCGEDYKKDFPWMI